MDEQFDELSTPDARAAPRCLAPLSTATPAMQAPAGSWDCHAHVLGPFDRYPLVRDRAYTPEEHTPGAYADLLRVLGLAHGVLVQPSACGTDNSLLVDALRSRGPAWRGVAVLDADVDDGSIAALHDAGVRGFRINLLFPGGPGLETLERTASRVAGFGWHAQLLADLRTLPDIASRLDRLPVPVVLDHMGHFPAELGTDWPGFRMLLRRLEADRTYVKLSGPYRLSPREDHIDDVAPIAGALIRAAPDRLVWGSDWPHVGLFRYMPDTAALLDGLSAWCPDEATVRRILVDNPRQLYF
ncbi:hydrolase [Bordetella genomosp. 8]|uniref:Hydrolase n=1 Tax=Bordetella genomosp. 8 TaxID=1416806 RepID=A0A1W6YLI5_9BORD|nr:amidohydrolase family protein [Bordetella genomosp. 8]ARP81937.1 hydrolase [Bordetella genomosp. 8]